MSFYGFFSLLCLFSFNYCYAKPSEQRKDYTGYKVLQVIPVDQQTVDYLRQLLHTDDDLDFWEEPSYVGREVQVMVPPQRLSSIVRQLENNDIHYTVHRDNVQDTLDPMWKAIDERAAKSQLVFDINDFNTLADINSWMSGLVCRAGLMCVTGSIGNSHEGRPITVFRISKPGEGRKSIYIDATIHAREWISTATLLKMLDSVARGTTPEAIRLADEYDWHFIPVVNPDGYMYTWSSDRYWRKNRKPIGVCFGTDLNRNFDFKWGTDGASHSPCSITFCGPSAGSEPEIQAVQSEIRRLAPTVKALISLHSKGQMWMFSWGTTVNHAGQVCERTDDHEDMLDNAHAAANAVQRTHGTTWSRGNSCEVIYATSGTTGDFAKGAAGIKYSYTLELRGDDWVIDNSHIELSYREVWNGVVGMADAFD